MVSERFGDFLRLLLGCDLVGVWCFGVFGVTRKVGSVEFGAFCWKFGKMLASYFANLISISFILRSSVLRR